ncbi:sulfotransferase [Rhodanobacter sp. 7MK24]|uniref:tetratricopeptide repeat-containing sulfotransferase family protein n=1 Tax=Rhodanobacter sp. 7MK24 TaxID=2775922 RepID=UPI0017810DDD|nr:tetratricopeptide repeat-containing sulfotransferase family protein [Rhodanobacter sp. 7MK24]MBD8881385.1 sulfotransferase [Rhodanobacter sp. 7MK24]
MVPTDTPSLNDLLASASRAITAQKLATAEQTLKLAARVAPASAEVQRLSGVVQLMRGSASKALEFLRRAVELKPDDFNAHMNLGSALFQCRDPEAAFASMRRACELAPDVSAPWYNLGRTLHIARHTDEARPVLEQAMALDPTHVMTRMTLASVLSGLGDIDEAARLYRSVLRHQPNHAEAWYSLANLKTVKLDSIEVQHIRQLLERPGLSADDRVWLGFALAKLLEDQHDLAASFHTLQTANAIKRRYTSWDIAAEHRRVDNLIRAFTQPLPPPVNPGLGSEVIFIACLPRSGSTLTEHILASHSQVEGANEIPDLASVLAGESRRRQQTLGGWAPRATAEDWHRLGCEYLERTAHWRKDKPRFTDKNLGNWSLVGPVLAMLPGARVVNTRRDPLETCFACYRQLLGEGADFSCDLESMVHYYVGYDRLSRFWQHRFPGRCHDHVYEDMLADPEGRIRELLAFCNLPFESACMEFHKTARPVYSTASAAQVRQPLRSDTARSARYGALLDPLRDLLRQHGIA